MNLRTYFSETNAEMRRVLRTLDRQSRISVVGPLDLISDVLLASFVEIDGSVFLEACGPRRTTQFVPDEWLINRSCWEQSCNRIELRKRLTTRNTGPDLVRHGIAVAEALRLKMRADYPRRRFRLHVSWNSKPHFDTRRMYEQTRKCTVSFWQVRRGEYVFAPLEAFKHEAIGELIVS